MYIFPASLPRRRTTAMMGAYHARGLRRLRGLGQDTTDVFGFPAPDVPAPPVDLSTLPLDTTNYGTLLPSLTAPVTQSTGLTIPGGLPLTPTAGQVSALNVLQPNLAPGTFPWTTVLLIGGGIFAFALLSGGRRR